VAGAGEFPDISLLNISAVFWNSPLVSFWSGLAGAAASRSCSKYFCNDRVKAETSWKEEKIPGRFP
jgi:hypothetical protein